MEAWIVEAWKMYLFVAKIVEKLRGTGAQKHLNTLTP
jgi:hypothetical protein